MNDLPEPKGFLAGAAAAGIRKQGLDLALIVSETPAVAAGATTRNKFFSPPVQVVRECLHRGKLRGIVANAKNANAATGVRGLKDARAMAAYAARAIGAADEEMAVASTGVIGQFLPMEKIRKGIDDAVSVLSPGGWADCAQAIMTTDTYPKDAGRRVRIARTDIAMRAIAKGVGMVHPNMGTTLTFAATDAAIALPQLRKIVSAAVSETFNAVTVDGDTSTSDTLIVMANGAAGGPKIARGSAEEVKFAAALTNMLRELAIHLARDGEGATKLIECTVSGARSEAEAREAARMVCASNLLKCAINGCDANWGRVAAALGNSTAEFEQQNVAIKILGVPVMKRGLPVSYDEPALQARMRKEKTIPIEANLGAGKARATAWGSDLSVEYIKINADYRT